jgi:hypothetical protein
LSQPEQSGSPCANRADGSLLNILQAPGARRLYVHDYADLNIPTMDRTMSWLADFRAERAIVMAQTGDGVLVNHSIDPDYLSYLEEIDIGPGAEAVLALGDSVGSLLDMLSDTEALLDWADTLLQDAEQPRLSVFYSGARSARCRAALESRIRRDVALDGCPAAIARLANRKDVVRDAAISLGIPTAPGELVAFSGRDDRGAALAAAVARQRAATGGVMVRATWSGGGLDNRIFTTDQPEAEAVGWLSERTHLESCLVESLLTFEGSPNVQLWVDDHDHCSLLATTDQRLGSDLIHFGNSHPYQAESLPEVESSAQLLGQWLAEQGYRGPLGIDFIASPREMSPSYCFVEVNGRVNGATYAISLFERLNQHRQRRNLAPLGAWISSKKIATDAQRFAVLRERLATLLYQHGSASGVVPYNTGLLSIGAASFVIVGTTVAETEAIEEELEERLRA